MDNTSDFTKQRERMVRDQIERRGVRDKRVLAALQKVPRHLFVPENMQDLAYEDCPLSIGEGQTISQPYIVALMSELLCLTGKETVLEIGTGSGYQAAVLGVLAKEVHSVERIPRLADRSRNILEKLSFTNVHVHQGDGSLGWEQDAPYEGILVTAAALTVPQPVLNQLADEGTLVIPVGGRMNQDLQVWQRKGDQFIHKSVLPVAFVPLRGDLGWSDKEWEDSSYW